MKQLFIIAILIQLGLEANAQLGINIENPDPSTALHINATDKGVIIPQVSLQSLTDQTTIAAPAISLLVYNINGELPGGKGYYYNSGTTQSPKWEKLVAATDAINLPSVGFHATQGNSGQLFPANTNTKLNFPKETYDLGDSFHGNHFIAPQDGLYGFDGQIIPTVVAGIVDIYFKINDVTFVTDLVQGTIIKISKLLLLKKGDVLTIEIDPRNQQTSGWNDSKKTYISGHLIR